MWSQRIGGSVAASAARGFSCLAITGRSLTNKGLVAARALPKPAVVSRPMSTQSIGEMAVALEQQYARPLQWLHWTIAAGTIACFALVQGAQRIKDNATKGNLMYYHKSIGVLLLGLVVPRVGLRLTTKIPNHIPGNKLEVMAGSLSHFALYAFMIFMPVSGVAMGYFGGKGLPFFGAHIPGAETPNGGIAKNAFKAHKLVGQAYEYFVPLHIGASFLHAARGHNIFRRMNPLAASK